MRTARTLTVSHSMLAGGEGSAPGGEGSAPGGEGSAPGGVSGLGGVSAPGGCLLRGVWGTPPLLTESQTPVKT